MSITFPNEVKPEIDWANPLTKHLKALLYCDGTNVIDLVTGTVATTLPTTTGTDENGTYWTGKVNFDIPDLAVDNFHTDKYYWYLLFGTFGTRTDGTRGTIVEWTTASNSAADRFWWETDGNYGGRDGEIGGNYATDRLLADTYMGDGYNWNAYGLRLRIRRTSRTYMYAKTMLNGEVSPTANSAQSSGTAARTILKVGGASSEKIYLMPIMEVVDATEIDEADIAAIQADPYSLLQTAQGVRDEYGLKFDGAGSYLTAAAWNPTVINFGFEIAFIAGSVTANIIGEDHATGLYLRSDGTSLHCWYNNKKLINATTYSFTAGETYVIKGEVDLSGIGTIHINDVLLATGTDALILGSSAAQLTVGYTAFAPTSWSDFKLLYFHLKDSSANNNFYWDLNQSQGQTVTDKINGSIATLVGFPADSGYVDGGFRTGASNTYIDCDITDNAASYSNDCTLTVEFSTEYTADEMTLIGELSTFKAAVRIQNHTVKVYPKNSTTGLVSFSGLVRDLRDGEKAKIHLVLNYPNITLFVDDIEIETKATVADAFTSALNDIARYSSNYYDINLYAVTFIDNLNGLMSRNYDFTTGDENQIIETLNNQHGDIVNAKTSGFMPIITKQVYTIGSGKDYATLSAGHTAQKTTTDLKEFVIYDDESMAGIVVRETGYGDYPDGFIWRGASPFDGNFSDVDNTELTITSSYMDIRHSKGQLLDLVIDATGRTYGFYSSEDGFDIQRVGVKGGSQPIVLNGAFDASIKDCSIWSVGSSQADVYARGGCQLTFLNNIVNSDTTYSRSMRTRDAASKLIAQNNIINSTATNLFSIESSAVVDQSYNVLSGAGYGDNIGTQENVDFTGAFVDEAGGDLKINQAWADTNLVGKGWNNSDIASWAYYQGGVAPTELTFTDINIGTQVESVTLVKNAPISFTDINIATQVSSMAFGAVVDLTFTDINVPTQVSNVSLGRTASLNYTDINVPTQVSPVTLGRTADLDYTDINVALQVEGIQLSRTVSLDYTDINVATQVSVIDLIKVGAIDLTFTDINIGTQVEPVTLTKVANLSYSDIDVETQVSNMNVVKVSTLGFTDIDVATQVSNISLVTGILLGFSDINIATQVEPMKLVKEANLSYSDIDVETQVESMSLQRYTNLGFSDIDIATQVGSMSLSIGNMPNVNGKNVLLINSTIHYSLINDTKHYNLT